MIRANFLRPKFGTGPWAPPGKVKLSMSDNSNKMSSDESSDGSDSDSDSDDEPEFLPHEPLILWQPSEEEAANGCTPIQVPTVLAQFLRPHQREGVQFCCEVSFICAGRFLAPDPRTLLIFDRCCMLRAACCVADLVLGGSVCLTLSLASRVQGAFLPMTWAWERRCRVSPRSIHSCAPGGMESPPFEELWSCVPCPW